MREGIGTTLYDATGNGSAAMGSGTAWSTLGKFGPAVLIPGDLTPEPRYAINAGNGPQPTCDFSAELWLKRLSGHQYGGQLIQQEIGGSNPWRWMFTLNGDRLRLAKEGASDAVESNGTLSASTYFNNWHHIAVTHSCSGQVRFYIDGALDSTKNFSVGGLNSASAPLRIGNNAYNNSRLAGYISGVAVSNVVRADFSYGSFAAITSEPTTTTDSVINPPVTGSPDLAILSLSTYPNPGGGALVEAVVQNQGNLSTKSGFYTDLYLDHMPTGSGDYSSSLRFWINDPIGPGATVALTTILTDLSSLSALAVSKSDVTASSISESSGTLYAQTDSAGLVQEPDNQNNIYSTGVQICTTNSDAFENDNAYTNAAPISIGNSQTHNFNVPGDRDWIKFTAQSGKTYLLTTEVLGMSADTYLYLYDTDGTSLIASNDDSNGSLASQIEWTAPQNGAYYVLVNHWNPNIGGCGASYTIRLSEILSNLPAAFNKTRPGNGATEQPLSGLTLTWASSNGVVPTTSYEYCYDATNDNDCSNWIDNGASTSKTLNNLSALTTYYWHVRAKNEFGTTYSNNYVIWSFTTKPTTTTPHYSASVNDGWTLESKEFSNVAGTKNNIATTLRAGDDALNRQYRSLLYFDTTNLPDKAKITKVTLMIKKESATPNFFTQPLPLGDLVADIKKGFFGLNKLLELSDFNALAEPVNTGKVVATTDPDWYQLKMNPLHFKYVNVFGATQFRLRFTKDDNNNKKADYISFYSGDYTAVPTDQPQLIIEYYVP